MEVYVTLAKNLRSTGLRLRWIQVLLAAVLPMVVSCSTAAGRLSSHTSQASRDGGSAHKSRERWVLSWSDDFSTTEGLKGWTFNVGGNGWSHKELQWYDKSNASVDGHLIVTASANGGSHVCWYGACQYTSVRMQTDGFFSQTYGKFQIRMKLPPGRGLWPAFWLEGADVNKVGWPACGEIDVVEVNNRHSKILTGFAHAPHFNFEAIRELPESLYAEYHTYSVDWTPQGITWLIDGTQYAHMSSYPGWAFDHPFFLILELAVGGNWPGPPNSSTQFPAHMLVDWIRVYRGVTLGTGR